MFTYVFIDWENAEKTAKQNFGSVINYEEFNIVVRDIAQHNGSSLVGIKAFGDFDKGNAGLMSRLVNLGIEPHHVVTKTAREYLKGSVDIAMSIEILKTMYTYPHISRFVFVSGDGDLRYVMRELKINGKLVDLLGFEKHTNKFIINMSNSFFSLDIYPKILRKVSKSEKEKMIQSIMYDDGVRIVITKLHRLEQGSKSFIGLNYLRSKLSSSYEERVVELSDSITKCIDCDVLETYKVNNPKDPSHPTKACKLNKDNIVVQRVLSAKSNGE